MDQIHIGGFIAELRKEKRLTQRQLAEKLNISDKTVSKWECGKGLPEVALMLPLCEELCISVNELLSGERLTGSNYYEKAEDNIMSLIKEKEENRKKLVLSMIVGFMCVSVMLVCVVMAGMIEEINTYFRVFLIVFGAVIAALGVGVVCVLDHDTGSFECAECKTRFVPSMRDYVFSTHGITTRRLKCPNCGKTTNCKHRMTK